MAPRPCRIYWMSSALLRCWVGVGFPLVAPVLVLCVVGSRDGARGRPKRRVGLDCQQPQASVVGQGKLQETMV